MNEDPGRGGPRLSDRRGAGGFTSSVRSVYILRTLSSETPVLRF